MSEINPIRSIKKKSKDRRKALWTSGAIEASYESKLLGLVKKMDAETVEKIDGLYKKGANRGLALDSNWVDDLSLEISVLASAWAVKFSEAAELMAKKITEESLNHVDRYFGSAYKEAGFVVNLKKTQRVNDVMSASIHENVALIKSIPSQFFAKVEGVVMRSVQNGYDLATMKTGLLELNGGDEKRAVLIARDQSNKLNTSLTNARQHDLGITKARWKHGGAAVHPRQSHADADGDVYLVDRGCLIDGEYILPGELINCGCASISILPGIDDDEEVTNP